MATAAVDMALRSNKPLPSPQFGSTRRSAPLRSRAPVVDDVDEPEAAEIDEAEPVEPYSLVPHVAEQTLHAVHSAIFGQPWADLELVVSGGTKDEVIYANSKILRKACPALMRQIRVTGRAELDTMEGELLASGVAKATTRGARPQSSRRSTNSLGLVDFGGRSSRLGELDDQHDREEEEMDEYADSVEQPQHDEHDEHDEYDHEDHSPVESVKVAGATNVGAPIEAVVPPTFSRSSSRFSKLIKFMNKDKMSPSAELEPPVLAYNTAPVTDYGNDTVGRGRVRRYSAANELTNAAPRTSTASRVQVTGCSAATLQALVFYLYTGHATFASRLPPSRRYADSASGSDGEYSDDEVAEPPVARMGKTSSFPPVFSATAAYCVGRQLGLRDLATKAFDHICLELSPQSVLSDLLSPFVDRFDEVQRAHLEYVSDHWDRVKRRPDFEHTVGRLVNGEYPRANKALLKLFAKLSVTGAAPRV